MCPIENPGRLKELNCGLISVKTGQDSGGSSISRGGDTNTHRGVPTYYFANFLPKTAWKWKNLDREGRRASLVSPWDQPMQDRHGRRAVRCNACIPSTVFPDPPLIGALSDRSAGHSAVLHLLLLFTQWSYLQKIPTCISSTPSESFAKFLRTSVKILPSTSLPEIASLGNSTSSNSRNNKQQPIFCQ